jgi:glucose-1-phosphate thymidylyltransferase
MKGIILAGGAGTRLHPITKVVSKQLLPIYDKPMIYYPLSVLMLAGIREILIISTPEDLPNFQRLFGTGESLGLNFSYLIQPNPGGLAQAFIIGEEFIGDDNVCLILGDNIFYGSGLQKLLIESVKIVENQQKSVIFGYYVEDPERYGVAEIDKFNNIISIEEKPINPKSNYAVVGLYFYTNDVINIAKKVRPSSRGELEITSVNNVFVSNNKLVMKTLSRGYAWLDTGTHEAMTEATEFIKTVEKRTSLKIACIEELAYILDYINDEQLQNHIDYFKNSQYGKYLQKSQEIKKQLYRED